MSLLWKTAVGQSWDHEPEDYLHDGVEEYGGMPVDHPDDTPYHNDEVMQQGVTRRETIHPQDDLTSIQPWLEKSTLDHFAQDPHRIAEVSQKDPFQVLHDEDSGRRYLINGNHRITVARELGLNQRYPAQVTYVHGGDV